MESKTTSDCKKASVKTVFGWLDATEGGLSDKEAEKRAGQYGYNEVIEKKGNIWLDFMSRFWGPIPWLLEIATVMCFFLNQMGDAAVLLFLLIMNTAIAFYNEHDSQKSLELLKSKLTIKARVQRDGKWDKREARELVPGDIIVVGLGDVVPADVKIIRGSISADQSALTGESLPVDLKESDALFTGSVVKRGEAKCIVVNTGMRTYFGKTVELVNIAKPKSRTEEIMFRVSRNLIYVAAASFLLILVYCIINKLTIATIFTFAVLFIGGGVPAALPMMFTIAQAKGATDLSKSKILVTKLDSIENAASVEILCLDKTGTLTMNELEVREAFSFYGVDKKDLLAYSALASSADSKDAIDNSVIKYSQENGVKLSGYKQLKYVPFEPSTKRAEGIVKCGGKSFKVTKGAPQAILSLCKGADKKMKEQLERKVEEYSQKGYRALAVAKSSGQSKAQYSLCGLLALGDPLRSDSAQTIVSLKEAGIRPIMLTGDNIAVAREIAKQAGIGERIVRISEIKSLPASKQAAAVAECNGIAEIYPEDKYWVVKLLQSAHYTVGMTGDGVNDAPALKQAELGIAVSNSTDVAKAAANMVITEPGTRAILAAVEISRQSYQRMLTWTIKKIARAIQFMLILAVGLFWFQDVIVSISGLMLLTVVNDFLTMSLAVDNARASKNPNAWNIRNITEASVFIGILFFIIELVVLLLGVYTFSLNLSGLQTLILLSLVFTGQLGIYIVRERGHFWYSWPYKTVSLTIWFSVVMFVILGAVGILVTPIRLNDILATLAVCGGAMLLMDFPKYWIYRKLGF